MSLKRVASPGLIAGRAVALMHDGQTGQGLIEYALLLALIALGGFTVAHELGPHVQTLYQNVVDAL